ncbi:MULTISPECIES: sensor histidine kinase [unclassified Arsukibacterium]|uniref:sensor histidine kinase n=1 Tax=unclassified Arsukibacterium TaxID=2635278 RepID=UPI000C983A7B|nr:MULTISPECIES: HAMP domain-containing sensor histidine kinase [unclassified Arsukibacterium]MAA96534.1 two-component sensor histidine kinase [Rheinheimera sp.]HAW94233.1 two-component sensor histidine kinase [Candidatus Azambacteria bacterium]|tara:strand:+ start:3045 stop:4418 length:1374 start_codon:yes stop_codon:yes gene_type:complete
MSAKTRNISTKFHSLSRRIVVQFCIFTLVISAVYSLISFILMYTLEDSFIEQQLQQEAAYLSTQYQQTASWPAPRSQSMQLHFSRDSLPDEIRPKALAEPERKEFFGQQGRHYHLYTVSAQPEVLLLAEVSRQLLVRPISGGVLQFLLISALLVSSIACLIAWFVSRRTTRPLKQLAALVDSAAPQQLPQQFSKQFASQFANDEVGILARTLEQSLGGIARALEREKSFTADVSHELRTPLAVIKNTVELWQSQQTGYQQNTQQHTAHPRTEPDADQLLITRIYDAAVQMEKTVQTLLILAREEHTAAKHSSTALMPLVERAILDNSMLLQGKAVRVQLCDSCQVIINANADMLKVLLDNLLSNAFKYTEAGEISIAFSDNCLLIRDTGPGIAADIYPHITEAGVKARHSTGFGFGLAIVKRLCEHQGWHMSVSSNHGNCSPVRISTGTIVSVGFSQ